MLDDTMFTHKGSVSDYYNLCVVLFHKEGPVSIYIEDRSGGYAKGIPLEITSSSELANFCFQIKPGAEIHTFTKEDKELVPVIRPFIVEGKEKEISVKSDSIKTGNDSIDRYVSLMEKQIDYLAQLQERNEKRLDDRLQVILKALKPSQVIQQSSPEINITQIAEQLMPLIEMVKKSGLVK